MILQKKSLCIRCLNLCKIYLTIVYGFVGLQESESDSKSSPTQCESPEHHPITVDIDIDIDMKPSDGDRTPELFSSGSLRQEGEERTIKTEEEPQKEAQIASKRLTGAKKRKSQPAKKLETDAYDKHPGMNWTYLACYVLKMHPSNRVIWYLQSVGQCIQLIKN